MPTDNNERFTLAKDIELIKKLVVVDKFDLDAAACDQSHWAEKYYTKETDGLNSPWFGNVFVNPPFDDIESWVKKAWKERLECKSISMLLPANRTEQKWWQDEIEGVRDRRNNFIEKTGHPTLETIFLPKRTKFGTPEDPEGKRKNNAPKFGCVLLIWR